MGEVDLYTYIISRTVSTIFRSLPVISPVTMKEVNTFFDADVASLFVTFHLSMIPLSVIYAECAASKGLSKPLIFWGAIAPTLSAIVVTPTS